MKPVEGRRQIRVQRDGGGLALQVTREDIDHDYPRWLPDSKAILYFTASSKEGESGTLWSIPTFGGTPRPLARSITGADVNRDGLIAAFQQTDKGVL